jgi:cation:H+ antiporter
LAASVVGALKNEADLSVGNILGSNLLNVLFVVGLVALIRPLQVDPASISIHFPVMIGFTVLLLPLAWTQYRITRLEGGLLVTGFEAYMVYLLGPYV